MAPLPLFPAYNSYPPFSFGYHNFEKYNNPALRFHSGQSESAPRRQVLPPRNNHHPQRHKASVPGSPAYTLASDTGSPNSTYSDISGPGRAFGAILSAGGHSLERLVGAAAERVIGPNALVRRMALLVWQAAVGRVITLPADNGHAERVRQAEAAARGKDRSMSLRGPLVEPLEADIGGAIGLFTPYIPCRNELVALTARLAEYVQHDEEETRHLALQRLGALASISSSWLSVVADPQVDLYSSIRRCRRICRHLFERRHETEITEMIVILCRLFASLMATRTDSLGEPTISWRKQHPTSIWRDLQAPDPNSWTTPRRRLAKEEHASYDQDMVAMSSNSLEPGTWWPSNGYHANSFRHG